MALKTIALASFLVCLVAAAVAAPIVENGDQPANGRRTVQLEELWRIGGLDDEENLLGLIRRVVADEAGNLYLLDQQLIEVMVFGPNGEHLRSVGREGDGPGEWRRPTDVVLLPDGTVGLVQGFPGRVIKVDREGLPAGMLHLGGDPTEGGFFALRRAVATGGHLVMGGADITRGDDGRTARNFVASYDGDGTSLVEYYEMTDVRERSSLRRDEVTAFFPDTWTLGADGRVWIPPHRNQYHVDVYLPDGTHERTITRRYESYRRTDREIEERRARMTPFGRRNAQRVWEIVVEPTTPDINQMHIDEAGRLWVLNSRGAHTEEAGVHSVWDVFDTEGRFNEQVALVCEGKATADGIIFPGHGLVVVIKGMQDAARAFRGAAAQEETEDETEAEPLEVICYRMGG